MVNCGTKWGILVRTRGNFAQRGSPVQKFNAGRPEERTLSLCFSISTFLESIQSTLCGILSLACSFYFLFLFGVHAHVMRHSFYEKHFIFLSPAGAALRTRVFSSTNNINRDIKKENAHMYILGRRVSVPYKKHPIRACKSSAVLPDGDVSALSHFQRGDLVMPIVIKGCFYLFPLPYDDRGQSSIEIPWSGPGVVLDVIDGPDAFVRVVVLVAGTIGWTYVDWISAMDGEIHDSLPLSPSSKPRVVF